MTRRFVIRTADMSADHVPFVLAHFAGLRGISVFRTRTGEIVFETNLSEEDLRRALEAGVPNADLSIEEISIEEFERLWSERNG